MIILPQTTITDSSFDRWKSHRIEVNNKFEKYYYHIIPLIDVGANEIEKIDSVPIIISSASDEYLDSDGNPTYNMRLFVSDDDDDIDELPPITTEEEIEILYKILTKKDLFV
jgi:hypothetical protein